MINTKLLAEHNKYPKKNVCEWKSRIYAALPSPPCEGKTKSSCRKAPTGGAAFFSAPIQNNIAKATGNCGVESRSIGVTHIHAHIARESTQHNQRAEAKHCGKAHEFPLTTRDVID
jgi:hypothetical protein